ncbi:hypothetical protein NDU88_003985 [Pleurodeles waltl]|uniref:Uncharacterized protein n=1 Tax=Pleurodeles waltl TaxID=8319 RepID=A0AAV7SHH2_PLEWA|nr:hypothetical protein NDU88_003985 [Pleurodeles waltl]
MNATRTIAMQGTRKEICPQQRKAACPDDPQCLKTRLRADSAQETEKGQRKQKLFIRNVKTGTSTAAGL